MKTIPGKCLQHCWALIMLMFRELVGFSFLFSSFTKEVDVFIRRDLVNLYANRASNLHFVEIGTLFEAS